MESAQKKPTYLADCLRLALIKVLFEIPVKFSTFLYECEASSPSACSICSRLNLFGRPSRKSSRCLAITLPSCVRSTIRSRSNSANPLMIVKIKQMNMLEAEGCEQIYSEKFTGTKADRPQFQALLATLMAGES